MSGESFEPSLERLRAAGLRATPQRRTILEVVDGIGDGHPTADDVFREARNRLPELSRATVYNTLSDLARGGLVQVVEGVGALRFDANLDREHQHFRCRACGGLFDVRISGLERLRPHLDEGFDVERARIVLEGTCPRCRPPRSPRGGGS